MQDLKQHFITTQCPYHEGTVEVFEQPIPIPAQDMKKAVLTITALGVYEAELNGAKIGDVMFAPGYTYYPHNLHVQTYDVTARFAQPANEARNAGETARAVKAAHAAEQTETVLRVYLGQGWYCGRFTCDNKTQIYGERPAAAWVLTVEHTDGTVHTYASSDKTVTAVPTPYAYAGFYDGEIYYADGAVTRAASDPPDETAANVYPPVQYDADLPDILEESTQAVRLREEMAVKSVTQHGDVTILDFGQNFAGIVEIDPTKMNGSVLKLRHGEILNNDGSLYTANLRKAKAEIVYHKGTESST